jgi:hypothetical protein
MAMREQDSLERYEPSDPGYDWDYEPEDHGRNVPNILWGRVAVLGAVVLLAFLFGRMTSGGGGVPEERLTAAQGDLRDAQATITTLEGDVAKLEKELAAAQSTDPTVNEDPGGDEGGGGGGDTNEQPAGKNYEVKSGDTLNTIAEKEYGDASVATYIADFNDILPPYVISPGDVIFLPEEVPES